MALTIEDAEAILRNQHALMERVEQGADELKKIGERTGETEAAIKRINDEWHELEAKRQRPASGNGQPSSDEDAARQAAKVTAFKSFLKSGIFRMPREQREVLLSSRGADEDIQALQSKAMELKQGGEFKAFNIADDTLGGYFVLPDIIQNEIIKTSVLYSPVRDLARVQPTSNNTVEIRYRASTLAAQWVAETGTRSETTGQTYGKKTIPTHEMYAFVLFSRQQLDDEYFDLATDLQADIAEQFGVTEGAGFVTGDGVGKPQGFLANVGSTVTAATSTAIVYADAVKTLMKLKPAYRNSPNCKWAVHQDVLSVLRQIVDGNGRPILQEYGVSGMVQGWEPTILGKPYVECVDMPSAVSGTNRTLAVGDFNKGYRFIDRIQMTTLRLEELYAASGQVGLMVYKRVGGEMVLPEAVAALKQS